MVSVAVPSVTPSPFALAWSVIVAVPGGFGAGMTSTREILMVAWAATFPSVAVTVPAARLHGFFGVVAHLNIWVFGGRGIVTSTFDAPLVESFLTSIAYVTWPSIGAGSGVSPIVTTRVPRGGPPGSEPVTVVTCWPLPPDMLVALAEAVKVTVVGPVGIFSASEILSRPPATRSPIVTVTTPLAGVQGLTHGRVEQLTNSVPGGSGMVARAPVAFMPPAFFTFTRYVTLVRTPQGRDCP